MKNLKCLGRFAELTRVLGAFRSRLEVVAALREELLLDALLVAHSPRG